MYSYRMSGRWGAGTGLLLLLLALPAAPAGVMKIERISPPPLDLELPVPGLSPAISADGRFIAFASYADNVVAGDTNHQPDVFVRDRQTGKIELVSVTESGAPANGASGAPAISADGRLVAFVSGATNLVSGGGGGKQIYLRDRRIGKTERVSVGMGNEPANGPGDTPAISADGRFVAFESSATNLVSAPTDQAPAGAAAPSGTGTTSTTGGTAGGTTVGGPLGLFLRDRQTGKTELVSLTADGAPLRGTSYTAAISADGRFVAFTVAVFAVPFGSSQVYVRDRQTGVTEPVPFDEPTTGAAVSADGRIVVFQSIVPRPPTGPDIARIYAWDRQTGKTELVSVSSTGDPADGWFPAISADGRFVAFVSSATDLVPGERGGVSSIYMRDRQTGQTAHVGSGVFPLISGDGRFVVFQSDAINRAPWGASQGRAILLWDRITAATEAITTSVSFGQTALDSSAPAISADGQWVAFVTGGELFERNRITGSTALVSATESGVAANGPSDLPAMSAGDRFVAFRSDAVNLVPGGGGSDIYVRDRQTGKTELVSVATNGAPGNGHGYLPAISADGRFVAFQSFASNLAPEAAGYYANIFLRNRQAWTTELVSIGVAGAPADESSSSPAVSADGRFVAFISYAGNLVPGVQGHEWRVYARDRQTGKTELVSVGSDGAPAKGGSGCSAISADGRFVAFQSDAANLTPGNASSGMGIYVRDREAGRTEWVGRGTSPSISADGRFVAFQSDVATVGPTGPSGRVDIYVHDRQSGATERVSMSASGAPPDRSSSAPVLSGDGRFAAFASDADNLVPGDDNGHTDVFVAERG